MNETIKILKQELLDIFEDNLREIELGEKVVFLNGQVYHKLSSIVKSFNKSMDTLLIRVGLFKIENANKKKRKK